MACDSFVERDYLSDCKKPALEGKSFGLLTVVRHIGFQGKLSVWLCRCICGSEVRRYGSHLTFSAKHPENSVYASRLHCGCASTYRNWSGKDQQARKFWQNNKANFSEAWRNDFDLFYEECWLKRCGMFLVAVDELLPIGSGNFKWSSHTQPWWRSANFVVRFLVDHKGMDEESAWVRVNSISRERLRQLANTAAGLCRFCSAPVAVGSVSLCEEHCARQAEKQLRYSNARKR